MARHGFLTMAFVNAGMVPPKSGAAKTAPAIFTMALRKIQPAGARARLFFLGPLTGGSDCGTLPADSHVPK
jgi:hypothetical protein